MTQQVYVNTERLYSTTDAGVWAEEFAKVCPDVDEGLMIGWFANAMATAEAHAKTSSINAYDVGMQKAWSAETFGPGRRTLGVVNHIRSELDEIEADPEDLSEWIDVIILAIDGAWRAGWSSQEIIDAYHTKMAKNRTRNWPDWRTMSQDQPIEHDRSDD